LIVRLLTASSLAVALSAPALLLTACDSGGGFASDSAAASEAIATTTVATTTSLTPPPPPLTHKQFVRQLDHLCRVGNRASARRFKFGDIYDTAESLDAYAAKLKRANRYIRKWNRRHHFFR
jgi:hypothetical protein